MTGDHHVKCYLSGEMACRGTNACVSRDAFVLKMASGLNEDGDW